MGDLAIVADEQWKAKHARALAFMATSSDEHDAWCADAKLTLIELRDRDRREEYDLHGRMAEAS